MFNGSINKPFNFGKINNLIKMSDDLAFFHTGELNDLNKCFPDRLILDESPFRLPKEIQFAHKYQ